MIDTSGFPIEIVQGADFSWVITYQDSDGNPINLVGYTAQMQVRQTINSEDPPLVDVSTTNGHIIIDAANGIITVTIPHSITEDLEAPLDAFYDIFITSGADFKTRLIFGSVSIPERVTR